MINCHLDPEVATIGLFVNQYAREPDGFSPLVERDAEPVYSKLDGCDSSQRGQPTLRQFGRPELSTRCLFVATQDYRRLLLTASMRVSLRAVPAPSSTKKTSVFLVDTTGTVYPDDPRKKTCCAKLCKFLNAALSILTGAGPMRSSGRPQPPETARKGSGSARPGRFQFHSHERGSVADNLGPFAFNSGRTENIVS